MGEGGHPSSTEERASWPDNPGSAARRAAQDLVVLKIVDKTVFIYYFDDFVDKHKYIKGDKWKTLIRVIN